MKKLLAAAGIAAAFIVPAHAASKKSVAIQKPQAAVSHKAALAKAKAAILYRLKDPESARWRQAKIAPNGNVCIEVNAKNSYGGYTGFETYFYNYRTGDLIDNEGWMAGMWCRHPAAMPKGSIAVKVG